MKKHLQIFFSFLLLLSISWQCAAKSCIYINFKFNQKKLAETVCENKDKPKSCCAAKCHLEKEIKKEDKRQSDLPSAIKDKAEKSELSSGSISFLFLQNILLQTIKSKHKQLQSLEVVDSIFHPPAIV